MKENLAAQCNYTVMVCSKFASGWEVKIVHVYRKTNMCKDVLANMRCAFNIEEVILMHPHNEILMFLLIITIRCFISSLKTLSY